MALCSTKAMNELLGILAIFVHGLACIAVIEWLTKRKIQLLLAVASSFFVGSVWIAWFLSLSSFFGINWNKPLVLLELFVSVGIVAVWLWHRRSILLLSKRILMEIVAVVVLFASIWLVYRSTELTHEFLHSDSQNYYFLRASIFFRDGGVHVGKLKNLPFTTDIENPGGINLPPLTFLPLQYPLLVSLNIDYVYLLHGGISIIPAKYLWVGVEWSVLLLLFAVGKTCFPKSRWLSFLPILMFYLIPNTVERFNVHVFGFADIWLGGFRLMAIWMLYEGYMHKQLSYPLLGLMGIFGCVMTKVEGMTSLWLLPLVLYQLYRVRPKWFVWVMGAAALCLSLFWYIKVKDMQPNNQIHRTIAGVVSGQSMIARWPNIIRQTVVDLASFSIHGLTWWVFFPLYLISLWKRKMNWFSGWLWFSIWVGLGSILVVYLIMETDQLIPSLWLLIAGTLTRFAVQWYPSAIAFLMVSYVALSEKTSK